MDRIRRMRVARAVGHVSWWLFVVARLMSEPGWTMGGMPRRYADYSDGSLFGSGLGSADYGWTAYEPLTTRTPSAFADPFFAANIITTVMLIALAATVIAALVEAILGRRWRVGAATVLAPVIGAAIILTALYERSGFLGGGHLDLPPLVVFVLVLFGVAVREVWSRAIAPRLFAADPGATAE